MSHKRSRCLTCLKQEGHTEMMSESEATIHAENNLDHHVQIAPDLEDKVAEIFE